MSQVDAKFIVVSLPDGTLACVDQHAADERCLLEELRRELYAPPPSAADGEGHHRAQQLNVGAARKDPPQRAQLTPQELDALASYRAAVERWGWRFAEEEEDGGGAAASAHQGAVGITVAPVVAGVELRPADLAEFLRELRATAGAAGGAVGGAVGAVGGAGPPAAARALASKACRGAIMFGAGSDVFL